MKKLKKALRWLRLIFMVILVGLAMGINGGIPVPPPPKKREETIEIVDETEQPSEEESSGIEYLKKG